MTDRRARNKGEAKRLACRLAAHILYATAQSAEWYGDFKDDREFGRFEAAWADLVAELDRRGEGPDDPDDPGHRADGDGPGS